jgi:hypothetical protein
MKRLLLVALFLPLIAAVPRPTPTPTPVALQYVEISKMVMPGGEQPQPGTFSADLQAATGSAGTATNNTSDAATPTPAPRRRGIGSVLGSVLTGNPMPGGPPGGQTGSMPNPAGMMGGANHATRYTYYYTKNWIREDDIARQISTITKCPQHQIITLNLQNKTYKIVDTSARGCDAGSAPTGGGHVPGFSSAPGTVDITVKSAAKNLGPKTVEAIATTGSDSSIDMSMANATGSCRNMTMQMRRIQYVSGIHKPRAYCPLSSAPSGMMMPGGKPNMGGCKPTMHSSGGGGMMTSGDNLEMWVLTIMNQVDALMERGQVAWLYKPQADPYFEIPAGFTEEK